MTAPLTPPCAHHWTPTHWLYRPGTVYFRGVRQRRTSLAFFFSLSFSHTAMLLPFSSDFHPSIFTLETCPRLLPQPPLHTNQSIFWRDPVTVLMIHQHWPPSFFHPPTSTPLSYPFQNLPPIQINYLNVKLRRGLMALWKTVGMCHHGNLAGCTRCLFTVRKWVFKRLWALSKDTQCINILSSRTARKTASDNCQTWFSLSNT